MIAREHFEVRQQVMRPQHGLRAAQVSIARDDGIRIPAGATQKRAQQIGQAALRVVVLAEE
jgi:hypothetical protein